MPHFSRRGETRKVSLQSDDIDSLRIGFSLVAANKLLTTRFYSVLCQARTRDAERHWTRLVPAGSLEASGEGVGGAGYLPLAADKEP